MKTISLYSDSEFSKNDFELTKDDYLHNSILRLKIKDYSGAIKDCTNAIKLDDKCLSAYLTRFIIRMELKEYSFATDDFLEAVSLEEKKSELKTSTECYETMFDIFIQLSKDERNKLKDEFRKRSSNKEKSKELLSNSFLKIVR
ncbi:hypothetical protein E0I26_02520 [Flavobacterium rhamnosiphilum]|uniref:Uncharacterized protein n=1 Tax=Flavobacterium rhamnosiphilum TaxID=2541724 RepID=A0A4R5FDF0_9FLAO|nr:hypothetical protein [Flavobacterium rhamnosiphilum]TDE46980.1 hypothetical protein E0I26_02520 [Flavobacterium rhamnosiphilum]